MYLYDVVDIKKAGSLQVNDMKPLYGASIAPQNYPTSKDNLPLSGSSVNQFSIDSNGIWQRCTR